MIKLKKIYVAKIFSTFMPKTDRKRKSIFSYMFEDEADFSKKTYKHTFRKHVDSRHQESRLDALPA